MFDTKPVDVVRQYPPGDDFLSPAELKALTSEKVIATLRALTPRLREKAGEAEMNRRPDDALWDAIRRSGYFYMMIPKEFGGLESDIDDVVDATLAIAEGCGSTGWLGLFGVTHNRHMVAFPDDVMEELFGPKGTGGRYIMLGGGGLPPGKGVKVDGGYKVSGHWKWGTVSVQSDWLQLLVMVDGEKGPEPRMALVPADTVRLIDTWHTDGMRATGTHDLACEDLFVPDRHVLQMTVRNTAGAGARFEHPIFRIPISPLLAFTTAVPTLGVAKAAVEYYRERLLSHTKRGTDKGQSEKQASQIRLAQADSMIRAAEMLIRDAMRQNLKHVDRTGDEHMPFRNGLRAQITYGAKLCKDAVILCCESSGTSIHYLDNPMQRCLRDIMVMTSHIILDFDVTMELHGRSMLGLPPQTTIT